MFNLLFFDCNTRYQGRGVLCHIRCVVWSLLVVWLYICVPSSKNGCVWVSDVGQRRAEPQHLPSLHNSPSLLLLSRMITVTSIIIIIIIIIIGIIIIIIHAVALPDDHRDKNEDKYVALDED